MAHFGITCWGPQNYVKDILNDFYVEPRKPDEVKPMMKKVLDHSTYPKTFERPDVNVVRRIDLYIGRVNGFPYGSTVRLNRMKKKGVIKPVGPGDMYRLAPTTSLEFERPDVNVVRRIDLYIGRVNGFPYGSTVRLNRMKKKGVIKPVGPGDMYRLAPTTSLENGWFYSDPAIEGKVWYKCRPRYPSKLSEMSRILDTVKKNDKYATLF